MKVKDIILVLEKFAPLALQESWDNSGLITGNEEELIDSVLLSLDVTEKVIDEAVEKGAGMIVSHHPPVFRGLKRFTGHTPEERIVIKALRHNIALYSSHTNFDNAGEGVNRIICRKLELKNLRVLVPSPGKLRKLAVFVPKDHLQNVRQAMFNAGAGHIGEYDSCSFNLEGEGTFRALEGADPFVGKTGEMHTEKETRVETIYPSYLENAIIRAMVSAHPYEEVAYDIYPLENTSNEWGAGMVGLAGEPVDEKEFLLKLKEVFGTPVLRHTALLGRKVSKVAVCGGSGSSLLPEALREGAGIFISSDFKYHQFFEAAGKTVIADVGHYESEQFTLEIFYELITKKFPKFAVHFAETSSNPINYM